VFHTVTLRVTSLEADTLKMFLSKVYRTVPLEAASLGEYLMTTDTLKMFLPNVYHTVLLQASSLGECFMTADTLMFLSNVYYTVPLQAASLGEYLMTTDTLKMFLPNVYHTALGRSTVSYTLGKNLINVPCVIRHSVILIQCAICSDICSGQ
jgi:hypothetical protein